jgi:disulfide bond formation protein DsbB
MTAIPPQEVFDHPRLVPALVVAASLGALAVALVAQHWGGIEPCVLCIYQRYAYLGAAAFGVLGLIAGPRTRARRAAVALAGLTFLTGAGIAAFHVGVEQHWWRGTAACHTPVFDPGTPIAELRKQLLETTFVPCDEVPWSLFGISIAGYNGMASLGLALASLWAARNIGRRQGA